MIDSTTTELVSVLCVCVVVCWCECGVCMRVVFVKCLCVCVCVCVMFVGMCVFSLYVCGVRVFVLVVCIRVCGRGSECGLMCSSCCAAQPGVLTVTFRFFFCSPGVETETRLL